MKEIKKTVYSNLKKSSNDDYLYSTYFNKKCEEHMFSDVDEQGRNLLSLYIMTKNNLNIKTIDKLYKKGCFIQEEVLKHPYISHYIDCIFRNKQKDRAYYFDKIDIPENQRLSVYISLATNYRFEFFKRYKNKENLEFLQKKDLLELFYKNLEKDLPYKFDVDVENKKLIIDELVKEKINPLTFSDFENPENIYNFGIFYIINKDIGAYMSNYAIKPKDFKDNLSKNFPSIYEEYIKLKMYMEKKSIELSLIDPESTSMINKKRL